MKAMRMHGYGDASMIWKDDVPRPVPGPDEALIRVAGTSFNPSEVGLRAGLLRSVFPLRLPHTLGWDVAGTVVETGSRVRTLRAGDRVIGRLDGGAAAEYVTAPADVLVRAPTTVELPHAAALPVAGLTAWQAVFEHAGVVAGQRILVNGAGGGVGGFALQLARHAGAHVVATAGPRSADAVRRLGAHQVVDYTATSLADALDAPLDAVLNLVPLGPARATALMALVRPGGVVVSATNPLTAPAGSYVDTVHFVARNDTGHLAELVALVDAGAVRLDVSTSRPLADLADVHRAAEAGGLRGKTILTP